jgi:hypothetical protein
MREAAIWLVARPPRYVYVASNSNLGQKKARQALGPAGSIRKQLPSF